MWGKGLGHADVVQPTLGSPCGTLALQVTKMSQEPALCHMLC